MIETFIQQLEMTAECLHVIMHQVDETCLMLKKVWLISLSTCLSSIFTKTSIQAHRNDSGLFTCEYRSSRTILLYAVRRLINCVSGVFTCKHRWSSILVYEEHNCSSNCADINRLEVPRAAMDRKMGVQFLMKVETVYLNKLKFS